MKRLVEYDLGTGGSLLVEVDIADEDEAIVPATSAGELVAKAEQTFEDALGAIESVARGVLARVQQLGDAPNEIGVEFGLKLAGGTSVLLASGSVEANLTVTLSWKREAGPSRP